MLARIGLLIYSLCVSLMELQRGSADTGCAWRAWRAPGERHPRNIKLPSQFSQEAPGNIAIAKLRSLTISRFADGQRFLIQVRRALKRPARGIRIAWHGRRHAIFGGNRAHLTGSTTA
jgi:hypothetical protein